MLFTWYFSRSNVISTTFYILIHCSPARIYSSKEQLSGCTYYPLLLMHLKNEQSYLMRCSLYFVISSKYFHVSTLFVDFLTLLSLLFLSNITILLSLGVENNQTVTCSSANADGPNVIRRQFEFHLEGLTPNQHKKGERLSAGCICHKVYGHNTLSKVLGIYTCISCLVSRYCIFFLICGYLES